MSIVTDLKGKRVILVRYIVLQSEVWEGEDSFFFRKGEKILCRARKIKDKDIKPVLTRRDIKLLRKIFAKIPAEIISISVGKGFTKISITFSDPIMDIDVHGKVYPLLKKHAKKDRPLYGIIFKAENFQTH
ncbi:MAG: hypothetical protein GF370_03590 [Candidatus Nealsonbacteria bacterium]|nr:hypothetical protein [Candidatus Nealsonbacteria bacterium]